MTSPTPPLGRARPGIDGPGVTRAVRMAVGLFGVGLLFIVVDVIPFFFGSTDHPLWLNLACLCAPAGLVLGVLSVLRAGRTLQRAALTELADLHD